MKPNPRIEALEAKLERITTLLKRLISQLPEAQRVALLKEFEK